jgi:hypothetical protein
MIKGTESSEGIITICCYCQAVRIVNSEDMKSQKWAALETDTLQLSPCISHGYCPECYEAFVLPMLEEELEEEMLVPLRRL